MVVGRTSNAWAGKTRSVADLAGEARAIKSLRAEGVSQEHTADQLSIPITLVQAVQHRRILGCSHCKTKAYFIGRTSDWNNAKKPGALFHCGAMKCHLAVREMKKAIRRGKRKGEIERMANRSVSAWAQFTGVGIVPASMASRRMEDVAEEC